MSATMPENAQRSLNVRCPAWCTTGPHNDPRDHLGDMLYTPATAEPDRFEPDTTNGPIAVPSLRLSLSATSASEVAIDIEVFEPQRTGLGLVTAIANMTLREATQLRDQLTHLLEVVAAADADQDDVA